MYNVRLRKIVVLPSNCQKEWFYNSLKHFGNLSFVIEEDKLILERPPLNSVMTTVRSADLVIYRRMRAMKLYPTESPLICVEWTPLRHPCRWGHYFADPQGFFHEGQFVDLFNNLSPHDRTKYALDGKKIKELYMRIIHPDIQRLIIEMLKHYRRKPLLALVVLQVHDDDTIIFGSKYAKDPHLAVISYAKKAVGEVADIIIKPHPAFPKLTNGGLKISKDLLVLEPYCPIWALLKLSDLVITINSSCVVESLIFDTPVIAMGDCPAANMKMCWTPRTFKLRNQQPVHTDEWIEKGMQFIGFLAESYGTWYPSPTLLIERIRDLLE